LKKIISALFSLTLVLLLIPSVYASSSDSDAIIDMHGAKTYLGSSSDWGKKWDEDNFEEVTDEDVVHPGNLTVKSGNVKNIDCEGNVKITGGAVRDIDCDGSVEITDGIVNSIYASGDITLRDGKVKHNVESEKEIKINGKITVGDTAIAPDIILSSDDAKVDKIKASNYIELNNNKLKTREINGEDSAKLELRNFDGELPVLTDINTIEVNSDCTVTANGRLTVGELIIKENAEFITKSILEVDTLSGSGTLSFNSGKLTVHDSILGRPLIRFNDVVKGGDTAFKADYGQVHEGDVRLYDYDLERISRDDYDEFKLENSLTEGITLNQSSISLDGKTSAVVKANIKPKFSEFAEGTKLIWEIHGETSAFSISSDSNNLSCTVSANGSKTGNYKATLAAYLVDKNGDRLRDYKSDSCIITYGKDVPAEPQNTVSGLTLDTSMVTMGIGNVYSVLAITDSNTPPVQLSYNSSIAVVGAPKQYNSNGKKGYLYPVKALAKGGVTIDIGGQKMLVKVAGSSIIVDTSSYTMRPNDKYCIGVEMKGLNKNRLNVHSLNSCTTVEYAGKDQRGIDLYAVKGTAAGTGYVSFDIIGGQSVKTKIDVIPGASRGGVSARLIAVS